MRIIQHPAHKSNYSKGRAGRVIDRFVIHATQGSLSSARHWFQNPVSNVSAHYGVGKEEIYQFVSDSDTAFHAGNQEVNRRSIGIEIEDVLDGVQPTDQQYQFVADLIRAKAGLYTVELSEETIVPHNKYRRTECPGDVSLDRIISMVTNSEPVVIREPSYHTIVMHFEGVEPVVYKGEFFCTDHQNGKIEFAPEVQEVLKA